MAPHAERRKVVAEYAGPLIALALLQISWAFHLWSSSSSEFATSDIVIFALHIVTLIALQIAFLALLSLLFRKFQYVDYLIVALASLFCSLAFYSLILIFIAEFAAAPTAYQVLAVLGVFLVCLLVFAWTLRPLGLTFVGIAGLAFLISTGASHAVAAISDRADYQDTRMPKNLTSVKFKQHPNVYLISFDALMPEAVAKHLLKIDTPAYVRTIEQSGMRILRNTFADRVPTNNSINSILSLDLDWFDSWRSKGRLLDTGEKPSPVYKIFAENGYATQFIFSSAYFGPPGAAHLDFYGTANGGICTTVDDRRALLGLCVPEVTQIWQTLVGIKVQDYPEMLFARIKETAHSQKPWLTLAYIFKPGHTGLSFNLRQQPVDDYSRQFETNSVGAAEDIGTLIKLVKENDPEAVLIIFGDHGPYVSRGLTPEDPAPLTAKDVIQDRHAVLVAVYPKAFCEDGFSDDKGPLGLVRLMRILIQCLAGGADPLPGKPNDDAQFAGYEYD